jgi:asparagine synthase (glutamine-hydrolysing)
MCGLTGFWASPKRGHPAIARNMAQCLSHRGPDDAGVWVDEAAGLALAHRRLSVLDLSPAGHQPMESGCGRYVLVYNGEIYNHLALRAELTVEGGNADWRGHSDTETLLVALRHWGVAGTLARLNGMFAFALWDARERTLFLARDRMGEKPVYYGCSNGTFLFGSELKSLAAHPDWRGEIDRQVLALYLRYSYVPSPWSIYRGAHKLPPAHYVVVREGGESISEPQCYWNLGAVAEQGITNAVGDANELTDALDVLLRDAVACRMVADVPLGTFLSGGYDSSTVAAMMQAQSGRPVKTFSIGFHEKGFNEAAHAKAVARHLATDHTELYVTSSEALDVIPKLPVIYDEPFADPSQIPTYLVSWLARQYVTVSLSGDGGDELFAGYNRHVSGPVIWNRISRLPHWARTGLGATFGMLARIDFDRLIQHLPERAKVPELSNKLDKLACAMKASNGTNFYKDLVSHWKNPESVVRDGVEPPTLLDRVHEQPDLSGLREQMLYLDMMTYLPDDILTKVDRASMAVSLEARVPLLDHRVVDFTWRVPTEYKYRDGQGKWLLRQVLYRYVPKKLMDRPKMGFAVPIGHWLRGPLRDWTENLLSESRLRDDGFFRPESVRQKWTEHLSGKRDWQYPLWSVLIFQAWLEESRK